MKLEDVQLDEETAALWQQLQTLHHRTRDYTFAKFRRTNPFTEDLFEWKEKGEYWGGKDVTIYDSTYVTGDVTIGDHTWIGPFCELDGSGGLTVGSYCSLSLGTCILTHDTVKWALSGGRAAYEYSPTRIGDCCFIGTHAVVTRGVTIDDHCVVGAGAVVTRDVPAKTVVAGVPARIIGHVEVDGEDVALHIDKTTAVG